MCVQAEHKLAERTVRVELLANRAVLLPFQPKMDVLQAAFGPTFSFGLEWVEMAPAMIGRIEMAVQACVLGGRKVATSKAMFWCFIFKGHLWHPVALQLMGFVRLLRLLVVHGFQDFLQKQVLLESPAWQFANLRRLLCMLRCEWHAPTVFRCADGRLVDVLHGDQAKLRHELRDVWRGYILGRPSKSVNLAGVEQGVDERLTRRLLVSGRLTPLQAGTLRALLVGSVVTPSRLWRSHRLTEHEAQCWRCNLREPDSMGHRWRCGAYAPLRRSLGLGD